LECRILTGRDAAERIPRTKEWIGIQVGRAGAGRRAGSRLRIGRL